MNRKHQVFKKIQQRIRVVILCCLGTCLPIMCFAQVDLSGVVVDERSFEPLAFVNIHVRGTGMGTTTNLDGKYLLTLPAMAEDQEVDFSFVGYDRVTYTVGELRVIKKIKLKSSTTKLTEVVIRAGDNPAYGIVRKATRFKSMNDPASLDSYSFNCYNKTIYTASGLDNDSTSENPAVEKNLRYGHLLVAESYSEVKRMRPNRSSERVLKSKFSGWDDPKLAMLSSSFQPFGFYEEQVNLFGTLYTNPLSDNSLKRYEFYLVDTLYAHQDTTYVLSFEPLRKGVDNLLIGVLYINTDRYAIENVIASPADTTLKIDFRIQQRYERVEGHWFPKELYTRYLTKGGGLPVKQDSVKKKKSFFSNPKDNVKRIPLVLRNRSYLSGISINPALSKKDFEGVNVEYRMDALKATEWSQLRPDSLSKRELQTYYNYDTLNPKIKRMINHTADLTLSLANGRVSVGKFSLLPNYLLRFNQYEKVGIGMGVSTNESFSKLVQVQGYGIYGFGDDAFKYGGGVQFNLNQKKAATIRLNFSQDIEEPGTVNYLRSSGVDLTSGGDAIRRILAKRMDSVQRFSFEYNFRPAPFTRVTLFSRHETRTPTYRYSLQQSSAEFKETFRISEVGINFRFLFKENITQLGGFQIITGNSFPYITARLSAAFDDVAGGEFSFTRADVHVKHVIHSIGFGKTTFYLNLNAIWGDRIPYPYLHVSNAFKIDNQNSVSVYAPGYFQTMRLYEFTSDRYAQLAVEHNFGSLFTALKGAVKPELVIVQNVAYGSLDKKDVHQGIEIQTLEKGYYESGVMLNNVLRINSKLYWLGYGAGVFYRYGSYALPNQSDNMVFILTTSIKL